MLYVFLLFYEFDHFISLVYKSDRNTAPKNELIERVKNSLEDRLLFTLFAL